MVQEEGTTCGSLYGWFLCCVSERREEREKEKSLRRVEPSMSKSKSRRAVISSILINNQPALPGLAHTFTFSSTAAQTATAHVSRLRLDTTSFTQPPRAFARHTSATVRHQPTPPPLALARARGTAHGRRWWGAATVDWGAGG